MLAGPLPTSILDKYSQSTSSLGCNALCMVISFLVLWSICLSSSQFHFKNDPSILPGRQPRYLKLWQGSCNRVWSRVIFWLFWDTFNIFFITCCLMVSASNIPKYLLVSFSPSVLMTTWFGSSTPSAMCLLPLFNTNMAHFSMPNSIPTSSLYILSLYYSFQFFLVFDKSLMSSMYIKWLIFSCDLLSLNLDVHFLRMWLNGIMDITNSNGDSAYPLNTPLCIVTSAIFLVILLAWLFLVGQYNHFFLIPNCRAFSFSPQTF